MSSRLAPRPTAGRPNRGRRGFTLVELMVVIVILGGLIAIVGPNVFKALFTSSIRQAEQQMDVFHRNLQLYYAENRKLPDSLDALTEADDRTGEAWMEKIPNDPWGNPYEYKRLDGRKYKILSAGPDGDDGTEDDIVWPRDEE